MSAAIYDPAKPDRTVSGGLPETLNRVAQVTIAFWIMKVLATTLGETTGDFLSMTLNLGYYISFAITFVLLGIILWAKIRSESYSPTLFWVAIIATTTAGTEVSDLMDRSLGLGYLWGSVVLLVGLTATLAMWKTRHGHLSVEPITSRRVETLFWIAVVFSNSLGTAFGDFLTDTLSLSYIQGAFITAAIIGVVLALHYATKINAVLLFWIAFIFTRPFGATFGDFLTKPLNSGGLNLPREWASLVTLAALGIVLWISTRRRSPEPDRIPE